MVKRLETLREIENLRPEIVVAGHRDYDVPNTADAIKHTRKYLVAFDEVLGRKSFEVKNFQTE